MSKMRSYFHLGLALVCVATAAHAYTGDVLFEPPVAVGNVPTNGPSVDARLRICSYNIQNFNDAKDDEKGRKKKHLKQQAKDAASVLKKIDADVVIIQEIENGDVLKLLNRNMGSAHTFNYITRFDYPEHRDAKLNIAVLSRLPLKDLMELDFSPLQGVDRPSRGVLRFSIELNKDERLLVYGVHLKSNRGEREENIARRASAVSAIRADIERMRRSEVDHEWHFMVAGDMNMDTDSDEFKDDDSLRSISGMVDLWSGRPIEERTTHPKRTVRWKGKEYPAVAFDRFLVSPSLTQAPWTVGSAEALKEGVYLKNASVKPGTRAGHVSDHYPIYVDLFRTKSDQ